MAFSEGKAKILFADDDEGMRTLVAHILTEGGYDVACVCDGADALSAFDQMKPDLVILDVMMPKVDGYEACSLLRQRDADAPVIMLTAKGDIVDKSIGFKSGADDYLVKPFLAQELLLRVDALLRRSRSGPSRKKPASVIRLDDLEIDLRRHTVIVRGESVSLTPKEFHLLAILASEPGRAFAQDQLVQEIWGPEYAGEIASIKVLAHRLRHKIEENPSDPRLIQTVWHVGYRFGDA